MENYSFHAFRPVLLGKTDVQFIMNGAVDPALGKIILTIFLLSPSSFHSSSPTLGLFSVSLSLLANCCICQFPAWEPFLCREPSQATTLVLGPKMAIAHQTSPLLS